MKTIIITGANGNLGSATVRKFLEKGFRVIGVDGRNHHLEFASGNSNFEFHNVDLSNEDEAAEFVNTAISKCGKIDGALMLVGGFAMGNVESTSGTDIKKQFTLNFETAYYLARPLLAHMKINGYGRLVFIGSRQAITPELGTGVIAYGLTKSLLFRLAEYVNAETKGTNVTASVVVPSTIDTAPNRNSMPKANPDNWVKAEQLADILAFICSDEGSPVREAVYKVYNNA